MEDFSSVSLLTKNYHVYPDFHGNRSPIANPELKGMVKNIFIFQRYNNSKINVIIIFLLKLILKSDLVDLSHNHNFLKLINSNSLQRNCPFSFM